MTLNFFTPEQGFQKAFIKPSTQSGQKDEYVTSLKKDMFKTSHATQKSANQDLKESGQREKFAEMMNALKNKGRAQQKSEADGTAEAVKVADLAVAVKNLEMDAFQTEESALPSALNALEPGLNPAGPLISLEQITMLHEEIQRLIVQQASQADAADGTISVTADVQPEKKVESIFALLASFLNDGEDSEEKSPDTPFASILEKIQDLTQSDDAIALTSGLTPEQSAQLQEHIRQYLDKDLEQRNIEALEALVAQFVSLIPPTDKTAENTTKAVLAISPEAAAATVPKEHYTQSRYDARFDLRYSSDGTDVSSDVRSGADDGVKSDFKALLKGAGPEGSSQGLAGQSGSDQSAGQRFLQMANLSQGIAPGLDGAVQQPGAGSVQAVQSPLQNSLTNVLTQSQHATQAHPATQMVSATIQKAVKAGEDTNIKLKLDPPELGRVEVKMSIDKDNITKVVLTIEKPETYTMLKQDVEVLERALQDAGLNAEDNLSFELADDGRDFDHRDTHDNGSAKNPDDLHDDDLIETTMDWHVDPATGRMHYNVLV